MGLWERDGLNLASGFWFKQTSGWCCLLLGYGRLQEAGLWARWRSVVPLVILRFRWFLGSQVVILRIINLVLRVQSKARMENTLKQEHDPGTHIGRKGKNILTHWRAISQFLKRFVNKVLLKISYRWNRWRELRSANFVIK